MDEKMSESVQTHAEMLGWTLNFISSSTKFQRYILLCFGCVHLYESKMQTRKENSISFHYPTVLTPLAQSVPEPNSNFYSEDRSIRVRTHIRVTVVCDILATSIKCRQLMKLTPQSRMCGTWPRTSRRKDGLGCQETQGNPLNAKHSFFFSLYEKQDLHVSSTRRVNFQAIQIMNIYTKSYLPDSGILSTHF